MQRHATSPTLRGLPGVPSSVPDYMRGESRMRGGVIEVKGWFRWSDRRKLTWMRDLVGRYAQDPAMNTFVAQTVFAGQGLAPRSYAEQAGAILRWVQNPANVYYVNERNEIIRTPWRTIADKTGDCDDMAVLMATFAEAVALPWRFVLAGKDGRGRPFRAHEHERFPWGVKFNHIYVEVGFPPFSRNPQWVSMEPTIQNAPLGYDVVRNGYRTDRHGAAQLPELAGWGDAQPLAPATTVERRSLIADLRGMFTLSELLTEGFKAMVVGAVASVMTLVVERAWSASRKARSRR